jgi:hypothetical protein
LARNGECSGQIATHAYGLRTLAGKYESGFGKVNCHISPRLFKHKRAVKVTARGGSAQSVFLDCDHFAALVLPTIGADGVGQALFTTVGASGQVLSLQGIVGAAAVAAALRVFTFWMRGHALLLV